MKGLNIRLKLTLWYGGVLAAMLTLFCISVYFVLRHQLLSRIDQGLREELADVLSEIQRHQDSETLREWLIRRFASHQGFDFQIVDSSGNIYFENPRLTERSLSLPIHPASSTTPLFGTADLGVGEGWRTISQSVSGPDGALQVTVARSLANFNHESNELLLTFVLLGPMTLLLAAGGGYVLARRTLRPIFTMTQTANRITASRLNERLPVGNPNDELGQLARTLNQMVERLERSFVEMTRFTADAAHELRTPLAVIRSEAEIALRSDRSPDEYRRVLENLLVEANRLSDIADQLLFLCRQDAGLMPVRSAPVNLNSLLIDVASNMQLVAQSKGLTLTLQQESSLVVVGEASQFRRVFYNLLDNAIKYTPSGGITASVGQLDGHASISVADTGLGIASEHLPRIFERFYRVDPSRNSDEGGAGLGLSICDSIVRGAGGKIEVRSVLGRGTTFTVLLPLCSSSNSITN